MSEAYSLSSELNANNTGDDPQLGETPKFSHFYLRQMRAEELYESLLVATQAHKTAGGYDQQEQAKAEWLKQFVVAFGTDEGDEATTFNGSIPQALMMFNGDMIKLATSSEPGSFLRTLADDLRGQPRDKIHQLFLAGMAQGQRTRDGGRKQAVRRPQERHAGCPAGHLVGGAEQQRVHLEPLAPSQPTWTLTGRFDNLRRSPR